MTQAPTTIPTSRPTIGAELIPWYRAVQTEVEGRIKELLEAAAPDEDIVFNVEIVPGPSPSEDRMLLHVLDRSLSDIALKMLLLGAINGIEDYGLVPEKFAVVWYAKFPFGSAIAENDNINLFCTIDWVDAIFWLKSKGQDNDDKFFATWDCVGNPNANPVP